MADVFNFNVQTQKAFIASDPPLVACRFIEDYRHFSIKCPIYQGPIYTRPTIPRTMQYLFSSRDENQAILYSVAFQEFILERIPLPWPRALPRRVYDLSWPMAITVMSRRDELLMWQTLSYNTYWWFPAVDRRPFGFENNLFDAKPAQDVDEFPLPAFDGHQHQQHLQADYESDGEIPVIQINPPPQPSPSQSPESTVPDAAPQNPPADIIIQSNDDSDDDEQPMYIVEIDPDNLDF